MFKLRLKTNVQGTIDYFLRDSDLSEAEKRGTWIGEGVEALALNGNTPPGIQRSRDPIPHDAAGGLIVREHDLHAVLQGYAPPGGILMGERLNARYSKTGRRCAWDCVLSPDKSISIAALCLSDDYKVPIRSAYDAAIQETFAFMQRLARRTNGGRPDIETGTLLAARFDHLASRWNDPQLHSHLLVANATFEPSTRVAERWYALEPIQLYRQVREIDLVFQRELARYLRLCGCDVRLQKVDGLPVAVLPAVSPSICQRLSRGHAAIQDEVGDQWEREERELDHKRAENRINDDLRPSKKGSLAIREQRFHEALQPEEAAQIMERIVPAGVSSPTSLPELSNEEIMQRVAEAGQRLGYIVETPTRRTRAALLASTNRMELPFLPFWENAHHQFGRSMAGPVSEQSWKLYKQAISQYWQAEIEETVLRPRWSLINHGPGPKTERIHLSPTSPPAHPPVHQGHGTTQGPATPGSAARTPLPSDLGLLEEPQERPGQSL